MARCQQPGLALAAKGVELRARMLLEHPAKGVAGADCFQLMGIAEQDGLGAALLGMREHAAESQHIEPAGLVEEENGGCPSSGRSGTGGRARCRPPPPAA